MRYIICMSMEVHTTCTSLEAKIIKFYLKELAARKMKTQSAEQLNRKTVLRSRLALWCYRWVSLYSVIHPSIPAHVQLHGIPSTLLPH